MVEKATLIIIIQSSIYNATCQLTLVHVTTMWLVDLQCKQTLPQEGCDQKERGGWAERNTSQYPPTAASPAHLSLPATCHHTTGSPDTDDTCRADTLRHSW